MSYKIEKSNKKKMYKVASDFLNSNKKEITDININDIKFALKDSKKFIMAMGEDEDLAKAFSKAINKEPDIKNATSLLIKTAYSSKNPLTTGDMAQFNKICKNEFKECDCIRQSVTTDETLNKNKKVYIIASFKERNNMYEKIRAIQEIVAQEYNIFVKMLTSTELKTTEVILPRQIAMYLAKTMIADISTTDIGNAFEYRRPTTVMSSYNRIKEKIDTDPFFNAHINELTKKIEKSRVLSK